MQESNTIQEQPTGDTSVSAPVSAFASAPEELKGNKYESII